MKEITSTNPSKNYEILGKINISTEKEIKSKVKLARDSLIKWNLIGLDKRIEIIKEVVNKFKEKKEQLALLISREMGMPINQAIIEIDSGIEYFEWYLNNAIKYISPEITFENEKEVHRVFYEPKGVVAVIVPWNFPFSNFVWQVGQNLIVGNTIVFKYSEETILFGKEIEKIFDESKIPKGVFNEVYGNGQVGDYLVHQEIDMICFTGSSKTGKYLYKVAADKFIPILMELGGSAPGIIFEDADIEKIIENVYTNRFMNCGQVCDGLKRLIVHESKLKKVIEKLKFLIQSKKIGNPEDKSTDIGPLVSKKQLETLDSQVKDAISKGAKVIIGGKTPHNLKGAYYEPTLLTDIKKNMKIWQEEVFGPVLPIVSFKTYEEAIELANDTKYGLGGYIFTENKNIFYKAASELKTGMVSLNNTSYVPHLILLVDIRNQE